MVANWQRIEPWIEAHSASEDRVLDRGLSEEEIAKYERILEVNFPDDFKEFHRRYRQDLCWRIGKWVLFPLEDIIRETDCMAEIMIANDFVDYELYWNPKWLVFAYEIKGKNLMALNLDADTDLEAGECLFGQLNEAFKFELEEGSIFAMGFGFGRWLEKWAIKLEKLKRDRT